MNPARKSNFQPGCPALKTAAGSFLLTIPRGTPCCSCRVEQPGLCFIMLPVLAIDPTYQLTLTEEDLSALALDATRQPVIGQGVLCFAVVAFGADGVPTANLLAPVVISLKNGKAVQQVRDDAVYGCRHPLSPEQSPCS